MLRQEHSLNHKYPNRMVGFMNSIEEPRKRFSELDVVRAIALLFLPFIHVYEEMELIGTLSAEALSSCKWVLTLCVYAPSVFMICFGANLFFAKEKTPAEYAKRGLKFLLIGVGLNAARFVLPSLISLAMGKPERVTEAMNTVLASDIYDFVGAFLLAFALFKKLRMSDFSMLITAMIMLLINTLIQPVPVEGSAAYFLGRFLYVNDNSYFPLLSWTIFPIMGYCFGKLYRNFQSEQKRRKFNLRMLIFCYVMYCALAYTFKSYKLNPNLIELSPANNYITDYGNVLLLVCIAGMMIGLIYLAYMKWTESKPIQGFLKLSAVIMPFYLIQWVIIGWMEELMVAFDFPLGGISAGAYYALSLGITLVTILLAMVFGEKINRLLK